MKNTEMNEKDEHKFPKRIWLLPLSAAFINLMTCGIVRSDGLFFVALMKAEHEGRLLASLPFSMSGPASIASGLLTGFIGPRLSFRGLTTIANSLFVLALVSSYFTTNVYAITVLTFLRACGSQTFQTILPQLIATRFKENRTTAMGVFYLGLCLAGILWPFLIKSLLEQYGLNGAYLLSGGIALHTYIAIFLISSFFTEEKERERNFKLKKIPNNSNREGTSEGMKSSNYGNITTMKDKETQCEVHYSVANNTEMNIKVTKRVLRNDEEACEKVSQGKILIQILINRGFYLLILTNAVIMFIQSTFNQIIIDFMNDNGIVSDAALLPITVFTCGGLIGRLCLGWITDKNYLSSQTFNAASFFITATTFLTATLTPLYYFQLFCYFIIGLVEAGIRVSNSSQFAEYFEREDILMAMSAAKFFHGFAHLFKTPIIGFFRDYLLSYTYFFVMITVLCYICSFFWAYERHLLNRKNQVNIKNPEEA